MNSSSDTNFARPLAHTFGIHFSRYALSFRSTVVVTEGMSGTSHSMKCTVVKAGNHPSASSSWAHQERASDVSTLRQNSRTTAVARNIWKVTTRTEGSAPGEEMRCV